MSTDGGGHVQTRKRARDRRTSRQMKRRVLVLGSTVALVGIVAFGLVLVLGQKNPNDVGPADQRSAGWDTPAYEGGARLAVDRTGHDFGDVPYGYQVEAGYRLKNVGDQVLRIENPEVNILEGC